MSEIVIVDKDESASDLFKKCKSAFKKYKTKVTCINANKLESGTIEIAPKNSVLILDYDSIVDSDTSIYGSISKVLSNTTTPFFLAVAPTNESNIDNIESSLNGYKSFNSIINLKTDLGNLVPLLKTLLGVGNVLDINDAITSMEKTVDKAMQSVSSDMISAKKLKNDTSPGRFLSVNGLNLHYSFCAGEGEVSEFFNIATKNKELLILLSSAIGHIITYTIVSSCQDINDMDDFSHKNMESLIKKMLSELDHFKISTKNTPDILEMLLIKVNTNKMTVDGYNFGSARIYSTNSNNNNASNSYPVCTDFLEESRFQLRLGQGERLMIVSPGAIKSKKAKNREIKFLDILNRNTSPEDISDSIFSCLKETPDSKFLRYDSSVLSLEVARDAIIQV